MFKAIEEKLVELAQHIPLELFSFLGSFVEEIIAPIPSPIIMTTTGSLAAFQNRPLEGLLILALLGALGKTAGALGVYVIADKTEDILLNKFGRLIGVTHKEIESIGKHFHGTHRDLFVLILLRSIPFIPSTLISVSSGILKVDIKHFVISTFVGTIIRDSIFLYFGYQGVGAFSHILSGFDTLESLLQVLGVAVVAILLAFLFYKRGKGNLIEEVRRIFR